MIYRSTMLQILQSQSVPMPSIGFPPEIGPPQLHPGQSSLVQPGIPRTGNPSEALRRAINAQLAAVSSYGEPPNQVRPYPPLPLRTITE